jgi:preprotein translocase subunit SecF
VGVSKRVDVELKKRWFKQKAGDSMATRKKSATKSRKMILTAVIGSLAALGIGGAGYVTWSAMKGSEVAQAAEVTRTDQKTSTNTRMARSSSVSGQSKSVKSRRVKAGTSCKITKSKKQKHSNHTASKHKRKKLRNAH